nr:hypothetical protein GCM10020093_094540 [Planobispora longispora]
MLRIFPLYWLVAAVSLLLYNLDRLHTPWDWIEVALLIHVFDPDPWWPVIQLGPIGLQQMWTLSVDVSFYLLLPFLAAALSRVARAGESGGRPAPTRGRSGCSSPWVCSRSPRSATCSPSTTPSTPCGWSGGCPASSRGSPSAWRSAS